MTSSDSFAGLQYNCLATSLQRLASVCDRLDLDDSKAAELRALAHQISPTGVQATGPVSPWSAADSVTQARSAINLLTQTEGWNSQLFENLANILDDAENLVGGELRKAAASKMKGLYVIIDPEVTLGRDPVDIARQSLQGGAQVLQLRDKLREKGTSLVLAQALKLLCTDYGASLIINDHADLAVAVDACGLHVGQGDLPVVEVRKMLRPWQVIGRSNHRTTELKASQDMGADHVAFGAIYATSTKVSKGTSVPVGPESVKVAKASVHLPLVAIGGINESNIEPVVRAGADAICVTGAIGLADDPGDASHRLVRLIKEAGGQA